MRWEQLSWYQKAAVWCFVGVVGWFAPEIALLVHFGGIEAAFAFLFVFFTPAYVWLKNFIADFKKHLAILTSSIKRSACARPSVFALQAGFCCGAFFVTSSAVFAVSFFMPAILLNGVLI